MEHTRTHHEKARTNTHTHTDTHRHTHTYTILALGISPFAPSHAWKVQRLWPESSAVRNDVVRRAGSQPNIKWIRDTSEMLWLDKGSKSMRRIQWLVNYPFMIQHRTRDLPREVWGVLCDGFRSVPTAAAKNVASFKLNLCGSRLKLYSKLTHPYIFTLFYTVCRLHICTPTATFILQLSGKFCDVVITLVLHHILSLIYLSLNNHCLPQEPF